MTIGFVCGNGISRQAIDLTVLRPLGKIYGCNAMYRDFEPDCLVATDKPIAEAIQRSGYSRVHRFHTRRPWADSGARPIPKEYYANSSGPVAVALAALDHHHRIYLLGFDMGPTENSRFNNVYAGTDFYKNIDSAPTYTGNWVQQLCAVAKNFPQTTFVRVCGPTTADIKPLQVFDNFVHINIETFFSRLSNSQDL